MISVDLLLAVKNSSKETQDAIDAMLNPYQPSSWEEDWENEHAYQQFMNDCMLEEYEVVGELMESELMYPRYVGYYGHKPEYASRAHYYHNAFDKNQRSSIHDRSRQDSTMNRQNKRRNARAVKLMIIYGEGIAYEPRH